MSMLSNQSMLPRLPVPDLAKTLAIYRQSIKPFGTKEEKAFAEMACKEFEKPGGWGEILQKRLIEYEKQQENSWLEAMWVSLAYLTYNEPVMINSNWAIMFANHVEHPRALLERSPPVGTFSPFQIKRAAGLLNNMLNILDTITSQRIPLEYSDKGKTKPLCMHQWINQFSITRWPGVGTDTTTNMYPHNYRHVLILVRNQFYKIAVVDEQHRRLSLRNLECLLEQCVIDVQKTGTQPNIPILTTQARDVWAKQYEALKSLGNNPNFEMIKESPLIVSLDDHGSPNMFTVDGYSHAFANYLHAHDGTNRWWDKSIFLSIMNNGVAGASGEHSPADAVVAAKIFKMAVAQEPAKDAANSVHCPNLSMPIKLSWNVDTDILYGINNACARAKALINRTETGIFQFSDYGGSWIKRKALLSPDSYFQMAIQLAYYRLHRTGCATYESGSLRKFLHGRTETIRSYSETSVKFTQIFDDVQATPKQKFDALKAAGVAHAQYGAAAANGNGCDRHLLALRVMLKPGEEVALFSDSIFKKSSKWLVSTSNVSPATGLGGMGFGPVEDEGYGINYSIDEYRLLFSVSSRRNAEGYTYSTDGARLRELLIQSLRDMRFICETVHENSKM